MRHLCLDATHPPAVKVCKLIVLLIIINMKQKGEKCWKKVLLQNPVQTAAFTCHVMIEYSLL